MKYLILLFLLAPILSYGQYNSGNYLIDGYWPNPEGEMVDTSLYVVLKDNWISVRQMDNSEIFHFPSEMRPVGLEYKEDGVKKKYYHWFIDGGHIALYKKGEHQYLSQYTEKGLMIATESLRFRISGDFDEYAAIVNRESTKNKSNSIWIEASDSSRSEYKKILDQYIYKRDSIQQIRDAIQLERIKKIRDQNDSLRTENQKLLKATFEEK